MSPVTVAFFFNEFVTVFFDFGAWDGNKLRQGHILGHFFENSTEFQKNPKKPCKGV